MNLPRATAAHGALRTSAGRPAAPGSAQGTDLDIERALDAEDPALLRGLFDLSPPDAERGQDMAWLYGQLLGPRPLPTRSGCSPAEAARVVRGGLAALTRAATEQILLMDSVESATMVATNLLYRRTDPRLRLFAIAGVAAGIHTAQQRCAAEFGLEPDKHVAWFHPRWGQRQHSPADLLDFLIRYGHEYSIVVFDAIDRYTGEPLDAVALTAAAHGAGCLVGWDISGVIGMSPVDLPAWNADFAIWTTDGYLNGGSGNVAGLYVAHPPAATVEPAPVGWSADAAYRLADALRLFDLVEPAAVFERAARLAAHLRVQLTQQLAAGQAATVMASSPDRKPLRTSVLLAEPNAELIARRLRADGVLVQAAEPDLLVLSAAPLYCTLQDCRRAAAALTRSVT